MEGEHCHGGIEYRPLPDRRFDRLDGLMIDLLVQRQLDAFPYNKN